MWAAVLQKWPRWLKSLARSPLSKGMGPVRPTLSSVMTRAANGLRDAHAQFMGAADEVLRASLAMHQDDTVDISEAAQQLAAGEREPDLVRGMIDMRMARYAYMANVAVVQTADEMMRSAIEIGAPPRWRR